VGKNFAWTKQVAPGATVNGSDPDEQLAFATEKSAALVPARFSDVT
jgi:hypothetical protein